MSTIAWLAVTLVAVCMVLALIGWLTLEEHDIDKEDP